MSTRALPANLVKKVQQQGWTIDERPFIAVRPSEDPMVIQQVRDREARPLLAIFTSRYAVEAVARWCPGLPSWSVACLSGATQEAVLHSWPGVKIVAVAGEAHALAAKIIAMEEQKALVFFCGNQRMDHLPQALQEAGYTPEELIVYETSEKPHQVSGLYDAVLFFSPSAVRSFFSLNMLPEHTVLFAIGQTTAASIRNYSKNKVILALQPTAEAMIDRVTDYWRYEK